MKNIFKAFGIFGLAVLFCCLIISILHLVGCSRIGKEPQLKSGEWVCKSIAPMPSEMAHFQSKLDTTAKQRAVGAKGKFWPNGSLISVKLINPTAKQSQMFAAAAKEWEAAANVRFSIMGSGVADIRVGFNANDGAWAYIGTDSKQIKQSEQTMNLGWDEHATYLHEIGHALGLLHEHQNPTNAIRWNEGNVINDLSGSPNYWDLETIEHNVFNTYAKENVIATELDRYSVMMYPIPAHWTQDGVSFPGGDYISAIDKEFIGGIYPKTQTPPTPETTETTGVTIARGAADTILSRQADLKKQFQAANKELEKQNALLKKHLQKQK